MRFNLFYSLEDFLSNHNPPKLSKTQWRRYMSRAMSIVDHTYERGDYLKYAIPDKLYDGLTDKKRDILTDQIITRYLPSIQTLEVNMKSQRCNIASQQSTLSESKY